MKLFCDRSQTPSHAHWSALHPDEATHLARAPCEKKGGHRDGATDGRDGGGGGGGVKRGRGTRVGTMMLSAEKKTQTGAISR